MDIAPITKSAIPQTGFAALAGVSAIGAPLESLALPLAGAESGASIVDISDLGQLLAAASGFQAQPASAGFGDLVRATQFFVGTLNRFQTSSSDLQQNPLGTPFDNVLALALDAPTTSGDGASLRTRLAQAGVTFEETSIAGNAGQFRVDLVALRDAFEADPDGTTALLQQAFQTLAQFAARLSVQNPDLSAASENSALPGSASASLFGADLFAAPFIASENLAAALRQLLADQALRAVRATSPAPLQPAAPIFAETAAAPGSDVVNDGVTAATGTIAVAPAATATVDQPAPSRAPSSLNAATIPELGVRAGAAGVAAIFRDLAAPATIAVTAEGTAQTGTRTPVSPEDSDNLRFRAIDPSVAAAIAAYRVGDGFFGTPATDTARALPELITDIAAVTRVRPVTLDLHDGAGDAWRSKAARDEVHPLDQPDLFAAFRGMASSRPSASPAI